jgi:hypothetical protein
MGSGASKPDPAPQLAAFQLARPPLAPIAELGTGTVVCGSPVELDRLGMHAGAIFIPRVPAAGPAVDQGVLVLASAPVGIQGGWLYFPIEQLEGQTGPGDAQSSRKQCDAIVREVAERAMARVT